MKKLLVILVLPFLTVCCNAKKEFANIEHQEQLISKKMELRNAWDKFLIESKGIVTIDSEGNENANR